MHTIFVTFLLLLFVTLSAYAGDQTNVITLPQPETRGTVSLEETIAHRRSVREFSQRQVGLEEISQLLWAAQGITDRQSGFRSVPSAGALYPLEIYLLKKDGIFHYVPKTHTLEPLGGQDVRQEVSGASWGQEMIREAPLDLVICAVFKRVTAKYGERGIRYVFMEAGHCAQNIHLMAVRLGLASVPVGAFDDAKVKALLKLSRDTEPVYIIPVGAKR